MRFLRYTFAFSLVFFIAQLSFAQGANACSAPMPGYTKLGEFEGHGYYLSDTILNWVSADAYTQANGQFLVSINSQEENDFIHGLVSELVLIGLSDLAEEGTPVWSNGDVLDYTNYSDCAWCAPNDENHNFGVMLPWDGAWVFDHYFRNAKHIVELPCGQISSEMTIACPDDIWMELPEGQLSLPISWDLPTATTDCSISDTIVYSQTTGAASGSSFITGVHTIGYQAVDSCNSLAECNFTVTITVPQDTGCGNIDGFTKLGEFEGHGYYMSDAASTWHDAKDFAEAAGGHLVTMNSKNENDFVQLHLGNEMVFIGYNDEATEGQATWANGEPVDFDQSYGNDAESDFAVMNFWNGQWVMVNQWVYKKYILEFDCGGASPTNITLSCPENIEVTLPTDSLYMDVSWDLPTTSTTCLSDVVTLTQTLGLPSGSALEQGIHTISYAAMDSCSNLETCSFEISVLSEGACGPIAGYTLLGEFNGHAYYLSDAELQWVDAQFVAATDGGYLATMNTQEENDFLQSVVGTSIPFIGYSDVVTEGTGVWANEDDVTIDLSYSNTDENDFAVINFWAGTWQMVNQWVIKKYVMEVSCGGAESIAPAPVMANQFFKPSIHAIYPNPADDFITVRLTNDKELDATFTIYDARGQVFLSENRNLPKGASELEFEITKLPAGMYFLQLGHGEYQRFVKMD